jgi:hypothetical protein
MMMERLSDEELVDLFGRQLPDLLERRPDLEPMIYNVFLKILVRKEEVAAILAELQDFRADVGRRFEQVDQRFEQVDQRFEQVDVRFNTLEARMEAGFRELHQAIDRLGARWGIRNESLFRQTIAALLAQSFGVTVEQRDIAGEQFDVLIFDHQHILVEIAASVGPTILERLERKRRLYTEATGIAPTRTILATASIHSQRAQALRQKGIEVIEPEEIE